MYIGYVPLIKIACLYEIYYVKNIIEKNCLYLYIVYSNILNLLLSSIYIKQLIIYQP